MKTSITFTLILFIVKIGISQPCECIDCPIDIPNSSVTSSVLTISGQGTNDIATCPLEKVCFNIEHTWVGDLSVNLEAPSGLKYLLMADINNNSGGCGNSFDNINVCIEVGQGNPLTENTEYACNGPVGTCLVGNWTLPCGGVTDEVDGAIQSPNCDLNDFNTAGDPIFGDWKLTVVDVCESDIGMILNWKLIFGCDLNNCEIINCDSASVSAIILPPEQITCSNPIVILDGSGSDGDVWLWYNETETLLGNTPTIQVDEPGCYTLLAGINTNEGICYEEAEVCVTADLQVPGMLDISGPDEICDVDTSTHSVILDPLAQSYNWSVPPNATIIDGGNGLPYITVDWADQIGGQVCVSGVNDCGEGPKSYLTVVAGVLANFEPTNISNSEVFLENYSIYATSYYWSFGDGLFSTTESPIHTYEEEGTYLVTLIASNNCGSDTAVIEVVIGSIATSEITFVDRFEIFPNPNDGQFQLIIQGQAGVYKALNLRLYNVLGQQLYNADVNFELGNLQQELDVRNLAKGLYFFQIQAGDQFLIKEVLIQ